MSAQTLFAPGQEVTCNIRNIGYCCWVLEDLGGRTFAVEKFPQSDAQGTVPVLAEQTVSIPVPENPPTREEAFAYWLSATQNNSDGTRKGGAFASSNFGVDPRAYIGDKVTFTVLENTGKNTIINVTSMTVTTPSGSEVLQCNIKAYACQAPSKQVVVDTPTFVSIAGVLYVRIIVRGSGNTVDYPFGTALAGGGFVSGHQTVAQAHDAETEEEGAKPTSKVEMQKFQLPPDTDDRNDPRYRVFVTESRQTFGMNRGRYNSIEVRFLGTLSALPVMYKATDIKEVAAGDWMSVDTFLGISDDTLAGDYVPWSFHKKIVRDAMAIMKC